MTAPVQELATLDRKEEKLPAAQTIGRSCLTSLAEAVQKYFDLMYDCDTSRFHDVFAPTSHLHGFRDGQMVSWSAPTYKDILDKRQSPKSLGAARADEILLMDFASTDMALVKVRVRIAALVFVDHLTWHRIDGKWLITSKGFHLESDGQSKSR
ncbi:MAG TPA: nuclear transport factor 2 family protein [Stellaceae bacterium]|nr:nuclear transport factor 2 family protein [Stellaceae bacterium]